MVKGYVYILTRKIEKTKGGDFWYTLRMRNAIAKFWTGMALFGGLFSGSVLLAQGVFENAFARLEINDCGAVVSLREKPSGRELAGPPSPVMAVVDAKGRSLNASRFVALGAGRYRVGFRDSAAVATVEVEDFRGGWTFRCAALEGAGVRRIVFFTLKPVCRQYVGARINAVSDATSGVCLRAYDTKAVYAYPAHALSITYADPAHFAGAAVGLVAGPREKIPEMMRGMTLAAGAPHSASGGAWSLGAEMNRASYLIADAAAVDTMDDLLEIAERTGMGRFHFRQFWKQYGWYAINTNKFPRGLKDLRDCSLKAKAAGLATSIHNLSGCVGASSPWVATDMAEGIRVCHAYTLAEEIPAEGEIAEIRVNEKPEADHGYDFATWSRGNTIRIGGEMFQYAAISREKPYAFKNVRRAAFGTKRAAHPAGAKADYLWCFFGAFLAEAGSPLALAVADRYAEIYRAGDFDGIYNDGLDGYSRWPAAAGRFMTDFYRACARTGKSPHFEDSLWTTHGWWFHSMVGSWDYARWSPKTFVDRHLRSAERDARLANFQEMTLGWWPVVTGNASSFGYMRDDVEYFGAKVAGYDCGFSLIPGYARGRRQGYAAVAQQVVLGWYERLRRAGILRPELKARFRTPGGEFRLAQDAEGAWKVRPVTVTKHHMVSPSDRAWRVAAPAACAALLRVRTLDAGLPWASSNTLTVLSAEMAPHLGVRGAKGVTATLATGESAYGRTLKLTAANAAAPENGAWAVAERTIPRPFLNLWKGERPAAGSAAPGQAAYAYVVPHGTPLAVGAWVKGDGSGADVNFQFHSPSDVNSARSEHHLTLDFTGWRYFVFSIWRDHQPEISERFQWPYMSPTFGPNYSLYERGSAVNAIEHVGLWMNGVKKGARATVEISDLRVMAEKTPPLEKAVVTLNGRAFALPFTVGAGEWAEWEEGFWNLYALDGTPLKRVAAADAPALRPGENEASFASADPLARAQITVTALGGEEQATVAAWDPAARRIMACEADYPRYYAPAGGWAACAPVSVRAGEKAAISFTLVGPVKNPVIRVGDRVWAAKRSVGANESVRGAFEGTFAGQVPVTLAGEAPASDRALLMLVKRYAP